MVYPSEPLSVDDMVTETVMYFTRASDPDTGTVSPPIYGYWYTHVPAFLTPKLAFGESIGEIYQYNNNDYTISPGRVLCDAPISCITSDGATLTYAPGGTVTDEVWAGGGFSTVNYPVKGRPLLSVTTDGADVYNKNSVIYSMMSGSFGTAYVEPYWLNLMGIYGGWYGYSSPLAAKEPFQDTVDSPAKIGATFPQSYPGSKGCLPRMVVYSSSLVGG